MRRKDATTGEMRTKNRQEQLDGGCRTSAGAVRVQVPYECRCRTSAGKSTGTV